MSVRAVWVIDADDGMVIFSRRFRTVERRARQLSGSDQWLSIPESDAEWAARLLRELSPRDGNEVARCDRVDFDPVFHFPDCVGPLVVSRQDSYIYVGLPLVELSAQDPRNCTANLEKMPAVTITLCMLKELGRVVLAAKALGRKVIRAEISEYMSAALPMGTISVVAADVATALGSGRAAALTQADERQPAWRPDPPPPPQGKKSGQGKVKGVLHVNLNEYVRAVQYDLDMTPDVCEVYGTVHCKAEIEDAPEVTLGIASTSGVESMVTHASVQSLKPTGLSTVVNLTHKLRFVPPSSEFELCGYKMCSSTIKLPIRGFFQMKAINDHSTRILIQLKLEDGLPNTFEYCEARLLFQDRIIASIDGTPNSGSISVSTSGHEVVWNLGHKWKSREIAAPVTVAFAPVEHPNADFSASVRHGEETHAADSFQTGDTGCVRLGFKIPDFTMSDSRVDPNSVTYSTAAKIKLSTSSLQTDIMLVQVVDEVCGGTTALELVKTESLHHIRTNRVSSCFAIVDRMNKTADHVS